MNSEDYGWEGFTRIIGKVKIRPENPHNGGKPRPEAMQLNGREFEFLFSWHMGDEDPYPGEVAFTPQWRERGIDYPQDAPAWIASGDIELVKNLEYGVDYSMIADVSDLMNRNIQSQQRTAKMDDFCEKIATDTLPADYLKAFVRNVRRESKSYILPQGKE